METKDNSSKPVSFLALCMTGDAKAILAAMTEEINIHESTGDGKTSLILAARFCKDPEVVSRLILAGIHVDDKDAIGWTALMYASCWNDEAVVSALISNGAELGIVNHDRQTALMLASKYTNSPGVIALLCSSGSNIEAKDRYGMTPLMLAACYNDNPEIVAELIASGAGITAQAPDGRDALHYAAMENGHPELTAILLEAGASPGPDGPFSQEMLRLAAFWNSPATITRLLESGINVNGTNGCGRTALMSAAGNKESRAVVAILLAAGANVNDKDSGGNTALISAASWSPHGTVELLCGAGANVNAATTFGDTVLMYAARQNSDPGVIKVLTQAGANIDEKNRRGETALIYAVKDNKNTAIARALVEAGADVNAEESMSGESVLMHAVEKGRPDIVRLLVEAGADVKKTNEFGETALCQITSYKAHPESAMILIDAGAEVNVLIRSHEDIPIDANGTIQSRPISKPLASALLERAHSCASPQKYDHCVNYLESFALLKAGGAVISKTDLERYISLSKKIKTEQPIQKPQLEDQSNDRVLKLGHPSMASRNWLAGFEKIVSGENKSFEQAMIRVKTITGESRALISSSETKGNPAIPDASTGEAMPTGNEGILPGINTKIKYGDYLRLSLLPGVPDGLSVEITMAFDDAYIVNEFDILMDAALDAGYRRIAIGLGHAGDIASRSIGAFVRLLKKLLPKGGNCILYAVAEKKLQVIQLLGFKYFLPIADTLKDAAAWLLFFDPSPCSFPIKRYCPICDSLYTIKKPGRYKCSKCMTRLVADKDGFLLLG